MPIEVGLWRLGERLAKVDFCALDSESRLETMLAEEKGFFGNQNSAAKPRAKKWHHTVARLKQRFGIE